MISDYESGKKFNEESAFGYFTEAYEYVTGRTLAIISCSESPDFICQCSSKEQPLGLELTKVMRDPESRRWDTTLFKKDFLEPSDAIALIWGTAHRKAELKKKNRWPNSNNIILVLQLIDTPLRHIKTCLTDDLINDFASLDFMEIWLADYSEIDAYGDIELFGLYPQQWRGYHQRPNPYRKPFA